MNTKTKTGGSKPQPVDRMRPANLFDTTAQLTLFKLLNVTRLTVEESCDSNCVSLRARRLKNFATIAQ